MGKYFKIGLFCLALLAISCSKEDENGPGSEISKSVTDEPFTDPQRNPELIESERLPDSEPEPQEINDDGDDESGPNTNKGA